MILKNTSIYIYIFIFTYVFLYIHLGLPFQERYPAFLLQQGRSEVHSEAWMDRLVGYGSRFSTLVFTDFQG